MQLPTSPYRPLKDHSDEALLRAYQEKGDTRCFTELFHRYAHLVLGTCCYFTKDLEESKDLAMQVFEKCLQQSSEKRIRSVLPWLFRITRNECMELLRRRKKQEAAYLNIRHGGTKLESEIDPPHEAREVQRKKLLEALTKLKTEQRRCIELFFFEQKTYREIARETSYSVGAVKSHLQNGKRRLRRLLTTS